MYLPTRLPETETRAAETSDPVAQTLLRAAQVIRERGWCQGTLENAHGHVCARGAIDRAASDHRLYADAVCVMRGIVKMPISAWNDSGGRTADEVISALERAALSRATAIKQS